MNEWQGRTTFVLRGGRVVDPLGLGEGPCDVYVEDGRLRAASPTLSINADVPTLDISGCIISPGFVDMHVHLREPGQEHKETIETGTLAAASGGFTAVACMPNTVPPIDTIGGLERVLTLAERAHTDVHVIAAITKGQKGEALSEMAELVEGGAVGFSDDGFPVSDSNLLRRAMEYAASLDRPIISHAEDLSLSDGGVMNEGALSLRLGLKGVPGEAEELGVVRDILVSRLTGCALHICHVSTRGSVEAIRRAKTRGVRVTAEATPHHFTLTEDAVIGYRTDAKMNPPLRTADDVAAVIEGLADGTLDAIATDHAPHTPEEKEAEFDRAPFGILGLETALGLTVTELMERGVLSEADVVRKLSIHPRRILGLGGDRLAIDESCSVTVWNPTLGWVVSPEDVFSRSSNTPFYGRSLRGRAILTVVNGKVTFAREQHAMV